jgi:hypothetical protein
MIEKIKTIFNEKKLVKKFLIVTIFSFVSFLVLTLVFPWSRFLFFNYFLKQAINQLIFGFIIIAGFSLTLGIISSYITRKYNINKPTILLGFTGILFIVSYVLMLANTSYSLFSYTEMNGFLYSFINFILLAPIISLTSFLILNTYSLIKNFKVGSSGITGLFAGIFSMGCPMCGALIYSLIGVTAGLTLFPFKGTEIKVLSLALLIFASSKLESKKCSSCNTIPKIKISNIFGSKFENIMLIAIILTAGLMIFNQFQISTISSSLDTITGAATRSGLFLSGNVDLSGVDVSQISSTAMAIASTMPELKDAKTEEDVMNIMLTSGIPEYSEALGGITFDDPVNSLNYLAKWYYSLKEKVKNNDPQTWQRYLNLAAAPRGISCEFCCGVGPQGIDAQGNLRCGCKHNPAVQAVALGLMKYTDYSNAQILREVMKWKTQWFPKNMIALGVLVTGQDPSQLKNLPGMVGGC